MKAHFIEGLTNLTSKMKTFEKMFYYKDLLRNLLKMNKKAISLETVYR